MWKVTAGDTEERCKNMREAYAVAEVAAAEHGQAVLWQRVRKGYQPLTAVVDGWERYDSVDRRP